jgi:hypothetical protein
LDCASFYAQSQLMQISWLFSCPALLYFVSSRHACADGRLAVSSSGLGLDNKCAALAVQAKNASGGRFISASSYQNNCSNQTE